MTEHTMAEDGVRIAFSVDGNEKGDAILLIHGTSACKEMWEFQIDAYSRAGFRVIAFDLRGGGSSGAPASEDRYTVSDMAKDGVAVLDEIGVDASHVVGHSLGGAIALRMALSHPGRVRTVQCHGGWGRTDEYLRRIFFDLMLAALDRGDLRDNFRYAMALIMSPAYLDTREPMAVADVISRVFIRNPNPISIEGFRGHLLAGRRYDILEELGGIAVPTLVATGELDANIPIRYSQQLADRIPGAMFHAFRGPRAAHCTNLEMAYEFNSLTTAFMRGNMIESRRSA